jgi:heme-degrading monooxygenase HmoA
MEVPDMANVVSLVRGIVPAERTDDLERAYTQALRDGPPPAIEETFLLKADGGQVAILSVWRGRADLDAMLASGEEPFARRLIRTAGGTPEATIYEVVARSSAPSSSRK